MKSKNVPLAIVPDATSFAAIEKHGGGEFCEDFKLVAPSAWITAGFYQLHVRLELGFGPLLILEGWYTFDNVAEQAPRMRVVLK